MDETTTNEALWLNVTDTAAAFGVSVQALRAWDVKPARRRGRERLYWLPDVIAYRLARERPTDLTFEEARNRKMSADARLAELELSRKSGELVEIGVVVQVVGEQCSIVRTRLLGLPNYAAPQLIGLKQPSEAVAVLTPVIHEVLTELSTGDVLERAQRESAK